MSKEVDAHGIPMDGLLPISVMKQILIDMINMRPRRSVFIWGPPGIGKSSIVYQVGSLLDYDVYELRLGIHDPVDLRGIPVPVLRMKDGREIYLTQAETVNADDVVAGVTKWFIPSFFSFSDKPTILFLDEMNMADRAVQKVAQQLVLNHRLGDYVLPENVIIVAAGNREEDAAFVQRMASPTNNRFFHFEVGPEAESWVDWAAVNDIHPMVVAFIKFNPDMLFKFDPKVNNRSFPTPRTWEFVSDALKCGIQYGLFHVIQAAVGKAAAIAFKGFMDLFIEIPDLDSIYTNPLTAILPANPSVRFSICVLLARKAEWKNLKSIKTYVERMGSEYCAYTVKYIIELQPKLKETIEFVEWAKKYSELLVDDRSLKKSKKK